MEPTVLGLVEKAIVQRVAQVASGAGEEQGLA